MRKGAALLATASLVALVGPGLGGAETSAQVRALAARAAAGDARALLRLRGVHDVDGRRFDVGAALAGADGSDLTARLRALSGGESSPSAATAPADAAAILSERRFHGDAGVHPLRGALARLGDGLHWIGHKLSFAGRPFSWLAHRIPGGPVVSWAVLVGILLVAVAVVATLVSGRRSGLLVERSLRSRHENESDPEGVERDADEAERQGQLELALRLRFRAGLMRLQRSGAVPRGQRTSRELRRVLRLAEFDRVSRGFDEVVYGGRAPSAADVETARSDWRAILDRAGAV